MADSPCEEVKARTQESWSLHIYSQEVDARMLAFLLTSDHGLHLYTAQNPLPRAWCHPQWAESSHLRHQDNPSGMSIGRLSKQCSYMVGA